MSNTNETMKVLFTDSVNTTEELDLLIRILSPLSDPVCVLLVTVHYAIQLYTVFKILCLTRISQLCLC